MLDSQNEQHGIPKKERKERGVSNCQERGSNLPHPVNKYIEKISFFENN